MPICQNCHQSFPNRMKIEGKTRNLHRRKYCLDCSPFNQHNNRKLHCLPMDQTHKQCPRCQQTLQVEEFYLVKSKDRGMKYSSYCKPCTINQATYRQRKLKELCVEYKGGCCKSCGYSKYLGALEFHHLDPTQKDFALSHAKAWKFNDRIKKELDKCVLLCSNCHKEVEAGVSGFEPEIRL